MIKINALYFLLLIEMLAIFAGLVAFLVFREKKRIILYREGKKELDSMHAEKEELQKQVAALKAGAAPPSANKEGATAKASAAKIDAKDYDACKMEITILEEKLKEKNKLLIDLQAKFDGVEKEYLLLYQQQAQEQQKN
jgi:predicted  nucleic acid-binding Zn-ribbon protein